MTLRPVVTDVSDKGVADVTNLFFERIDAETTPKRRTPPNGINRTEADHAKTDDRQLHPFTPSRSMSGPASSSSARILLHLNSEGA